MFGYRYSRYQRQETWEGVEEGEEGAGRIVWLKEVVVVVEEVAQTEGWGWAVGLPVAGFV